MDKPEDDPYLGLAEAIALSAGAPAIVVLVFDGKYGSGASVLAPDRYRAQIPAKLRAVAAKVEQDRPAATTPPNPPVGPDLQDTVVRLDAMLREELPASVTSYALIVCNEGKTAVCLDGDAHEIASALSIAGLRARSRIRNDSDPGVH